MSLPFEIWPSVFFFIETEQNSIVSIANHDFVVKTWSPILKLRSYQLIIKRTGDRGDAKGINMSFRQIFSAKEWSCILIGAIDLLLLTYVYLSPPPPDIHTRTAFIWIVMPALLLIIGTSVRRRCCFCPWIVNNFAVAHFVLFASIQYMLGSRQLIEATVSYLAELGIIDLNVLSSGTTLAVLIFLYIRLIVVFQLQDDLYEINLRKEILIDPAAFGLATVTVNSWVHWVYALSKTRTFRHFRMGLREEIKYTDVCQLPAALNQKSPFVLVFFGWKSISVHTRSECDASIRHAKTNGNSMSTHSDTDTKTNQNDFLFSY